MLGANLVQPTPLIYQRNKLFCFLGVISKFILILLLKISIERRNDIEDEIRRHYQWNNQPVTITSCGASYALFWYPQENRPLNTQSWDNYC